MNSKGDAKISPKSPTVNSESRSPVPAAKEKLDGDEHPDRSTKSQTQSPTPHSQLGLNRRATSASPAGNCCPQSRRKGRSASPGRGRPREFLTGLDYRTKFMREVRHDKTPVVGTRRPASVHVGVNSRSVKPASTKAVENAPVRRRTRVARSLTTSEERPREFLTGVDYRTKFMRRLAYDNAALKSRHNSGDSKNLHQTKMDARKTNQRIQLKPKPSLLKFPLRKDGVKKPTEVNPNLTPTVPNRNTSPLSTSTAEIAATPAMSTSGAKVKGCKGEKPPFGAQKTPETTKAGTPPLRQSRTKSNAMKPEVCLIQNGETATKASGSIRLSPALEQARNSSDLGMSDYFMHGINKFDLLLNLPRSPISERTGSNSLHTTPRSPRIGGKNLANSFLRLPLSETSSLQSEHSIALSETLEMQRASSPLARVSWPSKAHSHSKKSKLLPISDNSSLVYRSMGSFTNARRSKAPAAIKQEPTASLKAQFVPVVKWTSKTNSDDIFEPHYRLSSISPPNLTNSNANPADGDITSNEKSAGGVELSNRPLKKPANNKDSIALDERHVKRQLQTASAKANEDSNILHPSRKPVSANVRSTNKKSTTQDGTLSKKADTSDATNRMVPVKPAWKLTGSQQVASSGCSPWSPTPSPPLKRPQSVEIATATKLPAVYTTSTKWPVGDFAMRPRSVAPNKKPVWK